MSLSFCADDVKLRRARNILYTSSRNETGLLSNERDYLLTRIGYSNDNVFVFLTAVVKTRGANGVRTVRRTR